MDLVERLAREAGLEFDATVGLDGKPNEVPWAGVTLDDLRRFAALVAEECAKLVEHEAQEHPMTGDAAATIRAKFKEPTNG